jgi:hypothetical protein
VGWRARAARLPRGVVAAACVRRQRGVCRVRTPRSLSLSHTHNAHTHGHPAATSSTTPTASSRCTRATCPSLSRRCPRRSRTTRSRPRSRCVCVWWWWWWWGRRGRCASRCACCCRPLCSGSGCALCCRHTARAAVLGPTHPHARAHAPVGRPCHQVWRLPDPGFLEGVKSKDKAILKMHNMAFQYPGTTKPQLTGVSLQVRRVVRRPARERARVCGWLASCAWLLRPRSASARGRRCHQHHQRHVQTHTHTHTHTLSLSLSLSHTHTPHQRRRAARRRCRCRAASRAWAPTARASRRSSRC